MPRFRKLSGGDVVTVPDALADRYAGDDRYESYAGDASDLRGRALDEALEAADLPKSGTVADKQARLAEHQAATE